MYKLEILKATLGKPQKVRNDAGVDVSLFPIELLCRQKDGDYLLQGKCIIVEKLPPVNKIVKEVPYEWSSE